MRHIYVHVPFCLRRCSYCDFAIAVRKRIPGKDFVDAILREYAMRSGDPAWEPAPLETLYLGGGTPSLLPSGELARLVECLLQAEGARSAPGALEVTVEANPDDVQADGVRRWRAAGVTRVSLGAQSFDPVVLRWMHRTHEPAAIDRAVSTLRDAGIAAISLDLIFGRPPGLAGDYGKDLDRALDLEPGHISNYGLTVEPRTPLARWVERGEAKPASDEAYERDFVLAHDRLVAAGFEHYEVSNYARPGCRARHNSVYWLGRSYAGLGPSAHSYTGTARSWNVREWVAYERLMVHGRDPLAGREELSPEQRRIERIYLGLRTVDGAPIDAMPGWPLPEAERARAAGWLEWDSERVRATPRGWLRLDELAGVLTTSARGG